MLIASALWGVVRPEDRIPYYRLSAKARLTRIGPLATWWRPALAEAMPDEPGELVVDMRSGAYAAAWKPKRATLLAVRAFSESGGKRQPVSHLAKAVRGDVARVLLKAKVPAADPEAAAELARAAGFTVELDAGLPRRHRPQLSWGQVAGAARSRRGRVWTSTLPREAIVSRFEDSTSVGWSGQGVRTTRATSRPAARADSIVSRVWLIVPSPGGATIASG